MFVLLPCYSMEDFSFYMTARETEGVFASWSALFHPSLLRYSGQLPRWETAGSPNLLFKRKLVVIPPTCESTVPSEWLTKVTEEGVPLIRDCSNRDTIVAAALSALNLSDPYKPDMVDSFYAFGMAYFLTDLISRKFRYMSNLDTGRLEKITNEALARLDEGDEKGCGESLQKGFDHLCQTNEYYIPSPGRFLDLTRIDEEEDLGEPLRGMLLLRRRRDEKTTLFLRPEWLEPLSQRYPESLALVREELASGRVFLVGTEFGPEPLFLRSQRDIFLALRQARQAYQHTLGTPVTCYGREKPGFCPILPDLLAMAGFENVLLFSLDGWKLDQEKQSRIDWKSRSGAVLPTLAKLPVDGEDHRAFLRSLEGCGYSYRTDDLGTTIWSHRPGHAVPWWSDIVRINRFVPLIGETMGMPDFFDLTRDSGHSRSLKKDEFRTNALTRSARNEEVDPVSSQFRSRRSLLLTDARWSWQVPVESEEPPAPALPVSFWKKMGQRLAGKAEPVGPQPVAQWYEKRFSRSEIEQSWILRNEFFEVRMDPDTGMIRRLTTADPGKVQLSRGLLRLPGRGNRFSWQLALKLSPEQCRTDSRPKGEGGYGYSIMAADEITAGNPDDLSGTLRCRGRLLLPGGELAAHFVHEVTARRGSRILEVTVSFDPLVYPNDHAWNNYYGCRFAWKDELAEIRVGVHEQLWNTERDYLQAPEIVDIRSESEIGMSILSNGWPYYRRWDIKQMDSVLLPQNERERTFRFGIGVDLRNPLVEAIAAGPLLSGTNPSEGTPPVLSVESEKGTVLAALGQKGYNELQEPVLVQETGGNHSKARLVFRPDISQVKVESRTGAAREESIPDRHEMELTLSPYESVVLHVS